MIIIKNLDPNKVKVDEKPYKKILIYYFGHVTSNIVKPLCLIINKINGYIEKSNGNKYLTQFLWWKQRYTKKTWTMAYSLVELT